MFPVNYVQIFTTVICQTTPVDGCFCSFKKNYVTPTNSLIAKDKISIDFLRKHLMQCIQWFSNFYNSVKWHNDAIKPLNVLALS